jgi:hypothetical protein
MWAREIGVCDPAGTRSRPSSADRAISRRPGHIAATDEEKIAANLRALGATRFDLKYGLPGLTHDQLMTNIELYGQQVIPRVRELLS